jgi:hypothetical protein
LEEETAASAKLITSSGISRAQLSTVEAYPACIRLQYVCHTLQENGFPSAAGAENGKNTAARNLQIDPSQNGFFIEALLETLDMKRNGMCGCLSGHMKNELIM